MHVGLGRDQSILKLRALRSNEGFSDFRLKKEMPMEFVDLERSTEVIHLTTKRDPRS